MVSPKRSVCKLVAKSVKPWNERNNRLPAKQKYNTIKLWMMKQVNN